MSAKTKTALTAHELADLLNGNEYGNEITTTLETLAKEAGLVVVFGYSDDNCEFRGAINEEIPCYEGEEIYFNKSGKKFTDKYGDLLDGNGNTNKPKNSIESVWCPKNDSGEVYASWIYKTDIPHSTFDILEDEELYCKGIVFSINDLN